jgi:iron complex outermembrane receptor protein
MNNFKIMMTSALVGTLFALPQVANAAEAAAAAPAVSDSSDKVQDIVVTARRTEESLQRTPVAVTALSQAALTVAKVENVLDLQRTAPGLTIARGSAGGDGIVFVSIRGQGNLQPILANDPAVATYIDGIYVARPSTGQTDIQDVRRIEVLRGPQGTLFGRNTTGGAVNIVSNDPDQKLSVRVKGELGNYNTHGLGATVNLPLTDQLAFRVNYNFLQRDGYGKAANGRDLADTKNNFVRSKLKYDNGSFTVTLSGDYNKTSNHGQLISLQSINAAAIPIPSFIPLLQAGLHSTNNWWGNTATGTSVPSTNPLFATLPANVQALYGALPFNTLKVYGFGAIVEGDVGAFKLKSITGYRHSRNYGLSDTDGTAAPLLATYAGSTSHYISQEFQISGNVTDQLSFISGAYYGIEKGIEFSRSQIFGGLLRDSTADATNKTKGLFAQAYYQIAPTVRAVGGFRYTWDVRNTVLHNAQILGLPYNQAVAGTPTGINCTVTPTDPVTATTCNQAQNAKFHYPAWTAGLDWQASDQLFLYIKTSGAAKAGGWNLRAGGLPAFKPEKVKDAEVGLKADLFDRRVRFNTAAFYTLKTANQAIVNAFVPGIGVTQYIQNNGKVRIWGLESELTVIPWEGMTLSGNLSLQDGKYKKGSFSEVQVVAGSGCSSGGVVNGCLVDLSGLPLIQLPHEQLNLSATQKFPIGPGVLAVTGAWSYISSQHFDTVKAASQQSAAVQAQYATENALGKIPGYGLFSGRVAYQLPNPNVEIAVYGRNIANKKYIVRRFPDLYRTLGISEEYAGYPGTYGVELTVKF